MLLLLFFKRDTILLCVSSVFIFCFREAGIDPASAGDDGGRESSRLRDELVRFCSLASRAHTFEFLFMPRSKLPFKGTGRAEEKTYDVRTI